jgi:hypothetical protein
MKPSDATPVSDTISRNGRPPGGRITVRLIVADKDQSPARKFLSKKRKRSAGQVAGARQTMRPHDSELLVLGVYRLVALALDSKNRTSKSAGKILANIDAVIAEYRERLEANATYQRERRQLGTLLRKDLWFPESPLYQALHRELWDCWFYRGELHDPLTQPRWPVEEYRRLMKLPPFSLKSFRRWEKELWKLVRKHNPDLVPKLRLKSKREHVVPEHSDGVTKYQVKPLNLTWKLLRPQFRRHLKSVIKRPLG